MEQLNLFTLPTPSMPVLDTSRCEARPINYETAANMVKTYHYAHRVPSIVVAIGMYVDDTLAGCITYGIPPNRNMLACCGEEYIPHAIELNRLYIHDWAGHNSESWLIGQSFKWLQSNWSQYFILISYADPMHGHAGYIYRATNWLCTGTTTFHGKTIIVNGKEHHHRDMSRVFSSEAEIFEIDPNAIVQDRLPKYRYVYFLGSKKQRKELRAALKWPVLPYPKGEE